MIRILAILAFALAQCSASDQSLDQLLNAIAQVETGNDPAAVGDHGRALGAFQIRREAWSDVNALRRSLRQRCYAFMDARNPQVCRVYAEAFLQIQIIRFETVADRKPNPAELYCIWNIGFEQFKRVGFRVDKVCRKTRDGARRMVNLLRQRANG